MNSKQIFMIVTIVVALSTAMIATPVMAQNMSGGNVTGGNMINSSGSIFHPLMILNHQPLIIIKPVTVTVTVTVGEYSSKTNPPLMWH